MHDSLHGYGGLIREHYRTEAELYGTDASSTMRDEITRGREVAEILRALRRLKASRAGLDGLLDVGCGNAFLLEQLRYQHPTLELTGLEYTPELAELARARQIDRCPILEGDVRQLPFEDSTFDIVVTERCIINVMDVGDQETSFREVERVLRPGGHYICIEAFTDGLEQLNEAREQLGLEPNKMAYHNLWFDKDWFLKVVGRAFDVVEPDPNDQEALASPNFLSSHYFMSRVVYPALTRTDIVYNSHFVKFFSFLPPMGNYSPIQFWLLRKR